MNDPVPHEGESDGAMLSAPTPYTPTPSTPVAPPVPKTPLSGAQQPVIPVPVKDLPIAASPAPNQPAPKRAVDVMAPMLTPVPAPAPAVSSAAWENDLEASAASTGVSAAMMRRMAGVESGNNVNARATTSSAAGLFQITGGTWDDLRARYPQLNLTNRMDPAQQARVAPYYMKELQSNLNRALGRKPSDAESYLGWFLGPGDSALAVKADPQTPVTMVLDPKSIAANPGVFGKVKTIGDLYAWAGQKMGDQTAAPTTKIDLTPYLAGGKDANEHLGKMGWDLKSRISNMFSEMPPELQKQIKINSGYRSPERQAELWEEALKKYGSPEAARKWVAPPGNSQHNHGKAADLGYQSENVKKWVHANAVKYGLHFPLGNEDWHVEALGGREAKFARMGLSADPTSSSTRVPFTGADDLATARQREAKGYSLVQAAAASAGQDWTTSYLLAQEGKYPVDPAFRVTSEMLKEQAKGLPDNYLAGVARATSEQDFAFRLRQAERDHEVEQRLAATPYGTAIRIAVSLADPASIALGYLAPVGLAAKVAQVGRLGRFGAVAADGAIGGVAAELPAMLNKPGYEADQALWAAVLGTVSHVALERSWTKASPHVAPDVEQFIEKGTAIRDELEAGTFGSSSVGAAQNIGYREPVRGDIEDWLKVETPERRLSPPFASTSPS